MSQPVNILPYFPLAVRNKIIQTCVQEQEYEDIHLILEELDLPSETPQSDSLTLYLKRLSSKLFKTQSPHLIALLEHLVQLYLRHDQTQQDTIESLNTLLPPGVEFSLVSGRLLIFESQFKENNPYLKEAPHHWWHCSQQEPQHPIQQTPPPAPQLLKEIQKKRMKILEHTQMEKAKE